MGCFEGIYMPRYIGCRCNLGAVITQDYLAEVKTEPGTSRGIFLHLAYYSVNFSCLEGTVPWYLTSTGSLR